MTDTNNPNTPGDIPPGIPEEATAVVGVTPPPPEDFSKEKIGALLLKFTTLTQEQLDEALQTQKNEPDGLLGEILLKKNYIHPHDIIKVVCHQMNIPFTNDIKIDEIDSNIVKDIPINYAKHHEVLPIVDTDFYVTIVISDPFKENVINDLSNIFRKEIKILVSSPLKIQEAINRVYEKANQNLVDSIEDEFEENLDLDGPIDILDATADEAPVIRFVNSIIFRAVKERASDIHIEPYEKDTVYRFRINGVMQEILRQPKKTHAAVSSRIKVMAKLDIAEKRLPQDGRIKIKIAGKDIDIRLSTTPVQNGERIVMRILEKSNTILELEALGFRGKVLNNLEELSKRKHGVLYVTGPTGHGKTTTLFAILKRINTPDKMIITVEDPVEYEIPGISQIQVNSKIELTFAIALRSILRQNPDVVMVGETRDQETAEMAINASLTGHFVLSTLHTNDASSAPTRLIDMGVQPFLISSSLVAVLAQRLIRVLCDECKKPVEITEYQKNLLGIEDAIPADATVFEPIGCPKCNSTGYSGRTCVAELLMITDEIRALILKQSDASTIKRMAVKQGMKTLRTDAIDKVFRGITSIDEMMRAINSEDIES
ncbi:MAG: type II secretion system ATPase GspE [Halobacteriovoraceae bacterium]|nr:type II secretion system ATPase GspE [Halobacteriovoraceae bacterium]